MRLTDADLLELSELKAEADAEAERMLEQYLHEHGEDRWLPDVA